ncbi:MAG: hypothetical protein AMXMBFR82_00350 [Candidatus Hydrogenedentota bacterium]
MKHVFISHAGADKEIAEKLFEDLRNAGHSTVIDIHELQLGNDLVDFINDSITDAHTILLLYSRHTPQARWQKLEINAAVWNEVEQDGGTCIVVRLDDTDVPPTLGPKVMGRLETDKPESYKTLLDQLCETLLPKETASSIVAKAFRSNSQNPFRRVRAEFFEDRPDLLAATFAPPEALKAGALEEMKPCFLEGSRGTGKSMLLLSLRARNYLARYKQVPERFSIFGFYLKLTRGALCNAGLTVDETSLLDFPARERTQIVDMSSQEIYLCLLESLISEIVFCTREATLELTPSKEKLIADEIAELLIPHEANRPTTLEELADLLARTHTRIASFMRARFVYMEVGLAPITTLDLESFKRALDAIRKHIPQLQASLFIALLDEYENLFAYQQRIVNGIIKLATPSFSVKAAKKLGSDDVSGTTTGQELQETHDYTRLMLVYDVEHSEQLRHYKNLLSTIVSNLLQSENWPAHSIDALLPEDRSIEVDESKWLDEVSRLCKVNKDEFLAWPEERRKEKLTYYGEAATYRVLYGSKGRRRPKRFCGFHDMAFLSSGVIRYFQEFLGVSFHMLQDEETHEKALSIPASIQTRAIHLVSEHNLTTLSRNVELHGEVLKYLLLDIGDCLRHKLLKHGSEPEAARIVLVDPENLHDENMVALRELILVGEREGVFQTKEGRPTYKPRHGSDPQPAELRLCRVFAPVLEISPRLRWRTEVRCDQLAGLLIPGLRGQAVSKLKKSMVREVGGGDQSEFPLSKEIKR